MLCGPFIKPLKSWDDIWDISSTSTATIIALCAKCQNQDLGVYSHECCCNVMPEQCLYIFVGSSNVVWTLYQAFEELGWHLRHVIHLNCHHHCTLRKLPKSWSGGISHECHCNVMQERCQYIFVGSSNAVWTLYQAFEELGWHLRHFIHLTCHHHCTLWECQNQDLGGYTHMNVAVMWWHNGVCISLECHQIMFGHNIKSFKSLNDS